MSANSEKLGDQSEFSDPSSVLNPKEEAGDYSQNLEFRRWLILLVFVLIQYSSSIS